MPLSMKKIKLKILLKKLIAYDQNRNQQDNYHQNRSDTIFVTRNIFILKNIHFCNVTKLEYI